jgi:predicted RNA-binding Zn ribbon-like protein
VTPARQAATELARFTAEYPVALGAGPDGTLGLELDPVDSVDELIAQFVGIVFQAQLTDQWPRLKICASDECRWAFYDSSRNRGGTWCQMEVCGNRIKNRAYRQRKAAT